MPALAEAAAGLLGRMGYTNVRVIVGDGSQGFAGGLRYDAIIVSAAAAEVPRALLEQLAEGGRMIIPVGPADSQQLQLIRMENGPAANCIARTLPLCSVGFGNRD